jgi:hypothetical protein
MIVSEQKIRVVTIKVRDITRMWERHLILLVSERLYLIFLRKVSAGFEDGRKFRGKSPDFIPLG